MRFKLKILHNNIANKSYLINTLFYFKVIKIHLNEVIIHDSSNNFHVVF